MRNRVSISAALVASLGALALVLGAALLTAFLGARTTVVDLVQIGNGRLIEREVERLQARLDPVMASARTLHGALQSGAVRSDDAAALAAMLASILSAHAQVYGVGVIDSEGRTHVSMRIRGGGTQHEVAPLSARPGIEAALKSVTPGPPQWSRIEWAPPLGEPVVNIRARAEGGVASFFVIDVGSLSRVVAQAPGGRDEVTFILAGDRRVLAHRDMQVTEALGLGLDRPLPSAEELGDGVLAAFLAAGGGVGDSVRISVGGREFVVVAREVKGYDAAPWLVGRYYPVSEVDRLLAPARNGFLVGAVVLVIGLGLASLLGRHIAIPIRRFGRAAEAVQRFEFEGETLPRSRLAEIDDASATLDKMRSAMRIFGSYVPRRLVRRLIEAGEGAAATKRRQVTVMFTDLVGFTGQAEQLDEASTERMLNEHFAMLAAPIERNGGEIDKFIGDAIMAVWGGIKRMPDHAERGCEAALEIAAAVRADNARRRAAGSFPLRVRVGLHSGTVLAGNIGSPGRVNFTVIGNAVNMANRLEQLGKEYMEAADDVVVVVSADTIEALSPEARARFVAAPPRAHTIRGRSEPLDVYRLA